MVLRMAYDWAIPRGFNVKAEICLFTRKIKVGQFDVQRFLNKAISISDKVKYLGVILDRKLNRIELGA